MTRSRTERMRLFLDAISELRRSKPGDALFYEMDTVDNKTQALLTHVSIMMAILSIFYSTLPARSFIQNVISAEIFSYLLVTLGCLRSIYMTSSAGRSETLEEVTDYVTRVVISRRRTYQICINATFIITAVFFVTLLYHFSQINFPQWLSTLMASGLRVLSIPLFR